MAKPARYHVLLCHDTEHEGCAGAKKMRKAWKRLESALEAAEIEGRGGVLCTRTRCFGVCENGPIAVVYPDAVWYGGFEGDAIDRIVEEHLRGGREVAALAIDGPAAAAPRRKRR